MTDSSGFGVGAQVFVRDAGASDPAPWPASPSGVIIGAAGSAIQGVWGPLGRGRQWRVQFDEPQWRDDGRGPFEEALVNERHLELAPPYDYDEQKIGDTVR